MNISEMLLEAYKAGYERRICEQLDISLAGGKQSSSYNEDVLNRYANAWVEKKL